MIHVYWSVSSSFIGCMCLCIIWARLTKWAFLVGYFAATATSIILYFTLQRLSNLTLGYVQLIANSVGLFGGFLLPILITLFTTRRPSPENDSSVWSLVQEIDDPLVPWPEVFTRSVHS